MKTQHLILIKADENISSVYETVVARDNVINYDYSILVNEPVGSLT